MFLVVIHAYSKLPEVVEMSTGASGVSVARTIEELRRISQFMDYLTKLFRRMVHNLFLTSLLSFLKQKGIKHFKSSPYHPATNGLSERFIQTLKKSLKASKEKGTIKQRLANFQLSYCTTPHATTKEKPCVLLMGRSLCIRLDYLDLIMKHRYWISRHIRSLTMIKTVKSDNSQKES